MTLSEVVKQAALPTRKPGQASTDDARREWPLAKLILQAKMAVKINFGGSTGDEKKEAVLRRFLEALRGLEATDDSINLYKVISSLDDSNLAILSDALLAFLTDFRDSISKGLHPLLSELERRAVAAETRKGADQ